MVHLRDIAYDLPQRVVPSSQIAALTGTDAIFLERKVGVSSRRFLGPEESASDMAARAVEMLFQRQPGLLRERVDLLIVVTQNPDYRLPHMGAQLQHRCGLPDRVATFDVGLGCSGYVYGLSIARGFMVAEGARNAILVTADPYSKVMNPHDRNTMALFGDAATATWLSTEPGPGSATIGAMDFGTDGSGAMDLVVATGGSARPLGGVWQEENKATEGAPELFMNSRGIFNFLLKRVPASIQTSLDRNGLTWDDIDIFLMHQASRYLLETLFERLKIPASRTWIELDEVGNTVSSTIPLTLARRREAGYDIAGRRVLTSGFGVGLSWATTVLTFS